MNIKQLFLIETRLQQIADLREIAIRNKMLDEFNHILNEIKNMLVSIKIGLMRQEGYVFIHFAVPQLQYRINSELFDKMVFVFLTTIIREFYSEEGDERQGEDEEETAQHLPLYKKHLQYVISEPFFTIWKNNYDEKIQKICKNKDFPKTSVVLKEEELEKITENTCGICLDIHKKGETIICHCSHEFGEICFQGWINKCKNNVTCPSCRQEIKEITNFTV